MQTITDGYGRQVSYDGGDPVEYRVSDGGTVQFSLRFAASVTIEKVLETINAMVPMEVAFRAVIPSPVSTWKIKYVMASRPAPSGSGTLLDAANALAASDPMAALAWSGAEEIHRTSPLLNSLAPILKLSSDDVDALFIEADRVQA